MLTYTKQRLFHQEKVYFKVEIKVGMLIYLTKSTQQKEADPCTMSYFQTRDDFLGLVELTLKHTLIGTETAERRPVPRDFILRPRR